jgi:hypothetical protein
MKFTVEAIPLVSTPLPKVLQERVISGWMTSLFVHILPYKTFIKLDD